MILLPFPVCPVCVKDSVCFGQPGSKDTLCSPGHIMSARAHYVRHWDLVCDLIDVSLLDVKFIGY